MAGYEPDMNPEWNRQKFRLRIVNFGEKSSKINQLRIAKTGKESGKESGKMYHFLRQFEPMLLSDRQPAAGQRHGLWPRALWHAAELAGHDIPESVPGSGPATGLIFSLATLFWRALHALEDHAGIC